MHPRSTPFLALSVLIISSLAVAQSHNGGGGNTPSTHTITTSSDFGVLARRDTVIDFESVATGTPVTRCFDVEALVGRRQNRASAETSVESDRSREGDGVEVCEEGSVRNNDPLVGASAGTSNSAPGSTKPAQGAHSLRVNYPAFTKGTNAIVSIHWDASATAGASASVDVDVNGDGTPDFSATATGNRVTQLLQVTAGATGVTIDITTAGSAALAADGRESYCANLAVFVKAGTLPTSATFTNFGTACGAELNGTVGSGLDLSLEVTNAGADAFGFIVAGTQATTPTPLPGGTCNLLIDGRRFQCSSFRTDPAGAASISVRTPREALTISFQALLLTRVAGTCEHSFTASNGTELVCQ